MSLSFNELCKNVITKAAAKREIFIIPYKDKEEVFLHIGKRNYTMTQSAATFRSSLSPASNVAHAPKVAHFNEKNSSEFQL